MRLRMWGAGASETHTHSTARIAETDITPATAASSMRSTSAPRRPPTKLPRPCPQPLRVSPLRRPRACRRGCAPEIARIQAKNACFKPPIPKLGQSSAQDQRQSKSRKPSFESNVGGVGPVVADALDRPRRSILTGAAASKGEVISCIETHYIVMQLIT